MTNNMIDSSKNAIDVKETKKEMLLKMIMRQTNYTKTEAIEQLQKWNYNTLNVLKAYLNPDFNNIKKEECKKSVNQRMMTEIRTFCDHGTRLYHLRQDFLRQQEIIRSIAQENTKEEEESQNEIIEID